jgi:hypothetical protein
MDHNDSPVIVIEGMEDVLEMDLKKHKGIVAQTKEELAAYLAAASHERKKRKHYDELVGKGKFDDVALRSAQAQMDINLRHFGDKAKLSEEKIVHHQEIVDKLEIQLSAQYRGLKQLKEHRDNGTAD